jgi:hypothetical protein
MPFEFGLRYTRPGTSTPAWFADALGQVLHQRLPPIWIAIWTLGAAVPIDGVLKAIDGSRVDTFGEVSLDVGHRARLAIPCEEVEAFQLLDDPRIDTTDGLRLRSATDAELSPRVDVHRATAEDGLVSRTDLGLTD